MAGPNDVVLIHFDDRPSLFARIENIEPDIKNNWYHVTLLLLTIPMQEVTWILRDEYLDGSPFTMGGKPVRMEEVKRSKIIATQDVTALLEGKKSPVEPGKVIPFKKPEKD